MERKKLRINDRPNKNLFDYTNVNPMDLKGRVQIKERKIGDKKLYIVRDIGNLIVFRGRQYLLQRAINKSLTNRSTSATDTNWHQKYISWLAIGTGGAVEGSPMLPTSPELVNCQLAEHGRISGGTRYITVNNLDYHAIDENYPEIWWDSEIGTDDENDMCTNCMSVDPSTGATHPCDGFIVAAFRVTLSSEEGNQGAGGETYQDINEAGLFVSPSNDIGYSFKTNDMSIFSRVCFSTIRKDNTRELEFNWYLYF